MGGLPVISKLFWGSTEKSTFSGLPNGTMTFERQLWHKKGAVKKILKIFVGFLSHKKQDSAWSVATKN